MRLYGRNKHSRIRHIWQNSSLQLTRKWVKYVGRNLRSLKMEEKKDFTYSEKHPVAIAQRSKPEIPLFGIPFVSIILVNVDCRGSSAGFASVLQYFTCKLMAHFGFITYFNVEQKNTRRWVLWSVLAPKIWNIVDSDIVAGRAGTTSTTLCQSQLYTP